MPVLYNKRQNTPLMQPDMTSEVSAPGEDARDRARRKASAAMEQSRKEQIEADWPGMNERAIVAEMVGDTESLHWQKCLEFVDHTVRMDNRIPQDLKDDIAQKAMMSIMVALPNFRYECPFKIWLGIVVNSRRRNELYRNRARANEISFSELQGGNEDEEGGIFEILAPRTLEDEAVARENLLETINELHDFTERETIRNPRLFQHFKKLATMVLLEDVSLEEANRDYKMKGVDYMIRRARIHLRRKRKVSPFENQD